MKFDLFSLSLLLCIIVPSCQGTADTVKDNESFRRMVNAKNLEYEELYKKQEFSRIAKGFYLEDAMFLPQQSLPIIGTKAIESALVNEYNELGIKNMELEAVEIIYFPESKINSYENNRMGYERSRFTFYDSNNNVINEGKYIVMWENSKSSNNKWLIKRDMFSSNVENGTKWYENESNKLTKDAMKQHLLDCWPYLFDKKGKNEDVAKDYLKDSCLTNDFYIEYRAVDEPEDSETATEEEEEDGGATKETKTGDITIQEEKEVRIWNMRMEGLVNIVGLMYNDNEIASKLREFDSIEFEQIAGNSLRVIWNEVHSENEPMQLIFDNMYTVITWDIAEKKMRRMKEFPTKAMMDRWIENKFGYKIEGGETDGEKKEL